MENIAKVKLIQVNYKDVYNWLRKNTTLGVREAKDLSKNGVTIDFYNEYEKAISLYDYLFICGRNSCELVINHSFTNVGYVGTTAVNCF